MTLPKHKSNNLLIAELKQEYRQRMHKQDEYNDKYNHVLSVVKRLRKSYKRNRLYLHNLKEHIALVKQINMKWSQSHA